MANPVPVGSDVSSGTYRCTNCGNEIDVASTKSLSPCPSCGNGMWERAPVAIAPTSLIRTGRRA
jgi:predicted  nucleic acid-binding Zn-ribbon protein